MTFEQEYMPLFDRDFGIRTCWYSSHASATCYM